MPQAAAPPRPRVGLQTVRTFGRWDRINARQRERAKEPRFAACASLLTSPASRRPPPKCGAFRLQPRRSLLRQTGRWREADSNPRSRLSRGADLNREFAKLGDLAGGVRQRATSSQFHRIAGSQLSGLFQPAPARQAYRHRATASCRTGTAGWATIPGRRGLPPPTYCSRPA